MRTSRNISGPFIQGPGDYNTNEGFSLKDFLKLTAIVGSMAGIMYGIHCIDKYIINPKEAESNLEKQITLDFQKYDLNKDKVLNFKEFSKYYKENK